MRLLSIIGRFLYYLLFPFIALILRNQPRTRVIVHNNSRVLLVKHWLGSGNWDVPGGGVHKNELYKNGAVRELKEELGLNLKPDGLSAIGRYDMRFGITSIHLEYFIIEFDQKDIVLKLQPIEISEARWFNKTEIQNLNMHPDVKKIVLENI